MAGTSNLRNRITGRVMTDLESAVEMVRSLGARPDDFQYDTEVSTGATLLVARSPRALAVLRTLFDTHRASPLHESSRPEPARSAPPPPLPRSVLPPSLPRSVAPPPLPRSGNPPPLPRSGFPPALPHGVDSQLRALVPLPLPRIDEGV